MSDTVIQKPAPAGYSLAQIVLHWGIAALVIWQLVFGESLPEAERIAGQGGTLDSATAFLADSHLVAGFAILALVALRLVLRLARGAPPEIEAPRATMALARLAHAAFYALLFAMPVTGPPDYYSGPPPGGIHPLVKPLFIVLIAGHAGAALWHQFVRRDGTLRRMLVPAP